MTKKINPPSTTPIYNVTGGTSTTGTANSGPSVGNGYRRITVNSGGTSTNVNAWANATSHTTFGSTVATTSSFDEADYFFEFKSDKERFANKLKDIADVDIDIESVSIDLVKSTITITFDFKENVEDFIRSLTDYNFVLTHIWGEQPTERKLSVEQLLAAKVDMEPGTVGECEVEFLYKEIDDE